MFYQGRLDWIKENTAYIKGGYKARLRFYYLDTFFKVYEIFSLTCEPHLGIGLGPMWFHCFTHSGFALKSSASSGIFFSSIPLASST